MTIIEPLDRRVYMIEEELGRLSGTLVNGMPTVGKATAALAWLGHTLRWGHSNDLAPNVATGGSALRSTDGWEAMDGQTLEIVERDDAMIGNEVLKISTDLARARPLLGEHGIYASAISFTDLQKVEPWHIYTASMYTLLAPGGVTPSRGNTMTFVWLDMEGTEISRFQGKSHASKQEWNLSWVTTNAPENADMCRIIIEWELLPGEDVFVDKVMFFNGTDPQAWAYPKHGATDREAGLRAHLNMKAGIYNVDDFLTIDEVCNRLAGTEGAEAALALSRIPTPNPDVVPH